ncbi:MAG TPA: hypothetical protein VL225_07870 [Vicinamibacterales bacterium]|jgi:hypothetical protein|nr:hypothetical protein [Vicinamibacterales bacterium]
MTEHTHPHGALENPDTSHEHTDINIRAIIWFVVVLSATAVTIQIAMYGMFKILDRIEVANDPYVSPLAVPAGQTPPEPRLQTTPWTDLKELRAQEFRYLHSYGWIDEKTGVARMPIDKAKALLLQRGIPVRPQPADAAEGTHIAAFGQSNSGRTLPAGEPDRSSPPAPTKGPTTPGAPKLLEGAKAAAPGAASTTPRKPGGGL